MENTILNFKEVTLYGPGEELLTLNDFTYLYYDLDPKYSTDSKYYNVYTIGDNERLENISYKLYGTTKRWDIILILNGIHSQLQLPQDFNTVIARGELKYAQWEEYYGFNKPVWFKDLKLKYFTALAEAENEKYRKIKVLKSEYMVDFMYDLDDIIKSYQNSEG